MINSIGKENYNSSGIYQIRNLNNGKVYIGSAYNLYNRFRVHKSCLCLNNHDNDHLQKSYNKHGSDKFIFEVIEILNSIENIYDVELEYISKFYGENCYNISKETNPNKSLIEYNNSKKKRFTLISPNNEEVEFFGLTEASRLINSSPSFISRLLKGEVKSCKGWRLIDNIDYDYKNYRRTKNRGAKSHNILLIGPDGNLYGPIFNLEEFARQQGLKSSVFSNIINGRTRYCNGWSLYDGTLEMPIEKNAKVYSVTLIDPDGLEFENIKNLTKFCRERNLSPAGLRSLIAGKIKKLNYKGWKIKNN